MGMFSDWVLVGSVASSVRLYFLATFNIVWRFLGRCFMVGAHCWRNVFILAAGGTTGCGCTFAAIIRSAKCAHAGRSLSGFR